MENQRQRVNLEEGKSEIRIIVIHQVELSEPTLRQFKKWRHRFERTRDEAEAKISS